MHKLTTTLAALLLVLAPASALAQADGGGGPAAAAEEEGASKGLSVTISPVHLIFPMLEVTAEFPLAKSLSAAVTGGYGALTAQDSLKNDISFTIIEFGAQARYYLTGDFSGWHVGAETQYLSVSAESDTDASVTAVGEGIALGGYGGWKFMGDSGFTFVFQLGAQAAGIGAKAEDSDTGQEEEASDSLVGVLLNLDLGWSF